MRTAVLASVGVAAASATSTTADALISELNTINIVGIVGASVLFVAAIIGGIVFFMGRKHRSHDHM